MISEYDQELPQSQTADKPMVPREMPHNYQQEDKLSKATSSLKTRMDIKYSITKHRTISESHNLTNTQHPSTTTEPPP